MRPTGQARIEAQLAPLFPGFQAGRRASAAFPARGGRPASEQHPAATPAFPCGRALLRVRPVKPAQAAGSAARGRGPGARRAARASPRLPSRGPRRPLPGRPLSLPDARRPRQPSGGPAPSVTAPPPAARPGPAGAAARPEARPRGAEGFRRAATSPRRLRPLQTLFGLQRPMKGSVGVP